MMWRKPSAAPRAQCDDTSDASKTEDWRRLDMVAVTVVEEAGAWRPRDANWSSISRPKDVQIPRSHGASASARKQSVTSCGVWDGKEGREFGELRSRINVRHLA